MEKLLNPYDKEYMKMAMLKHEETFREQVYELHRLYQIQKILMKNISRNRQNGLQDQERLNPKFNATDPLNQVINDHLDNIHTRNRQCLDLERPAENCIKSSDGDGAIETEDESQLELTLGPTNYYTRRKAAEMSPLPSDSAPSFSSSSTGSSSHQKINTKREIAAQKWGLEMPVMNPSFPNGRRNSTSEVEEQLRQDRLNNPPWLIQVLSLNMT